MLRINPTTGILYFDNGNVTGPTSGGSTDNAFPRWNGTSGTSLQDSLVTSDDNGLTAINGVGSPTTFTIWDDANYRQTFYVEDGAKQAWYWGNAGTIDNYMSIELSGGQNRWNNKGRDLRFDSSTITGIMTLNNTTGATTFSDGTNTLTLTPITGGATITGNAGGSFNVTDKVYTGNIDISGVAQLLGTSTIFDDPASGASITVDYSAGIPRMFVGGANNMYFGDANGYLDFAPGAFSGNPKFTYTRVADTSGSLFRVTTTGASLNSSAGTQYGLCIDPTVGQSGTAGYNMLRVNPTESTTGSGTKNLALFQVGGVDKLSISNAGVTRIANTGSSYLYNTVDQTTNTEFLKTYWDTNVAKIMSDAAGSGTIRALTIGNSAISNLTFNYSGLEKTVLLTSSGTAGVTGVKNYHTGTASSGTTIGTAINNTWNQTGTAGDTDLLINRTETALGSGNHYFIDLQVGGTNKFRVNNTGYTRLYEAEIVSGNGIHSSDSTGTCRISGGSLNDGAVILCGGSTHTSIANKGYLRIGSTDVLEWNSSSITMASGKDILFAVDSTSDIGSSSAYAANAYIDKVYLNSTASIDGTVAGTANVTGNITVSGNIYSVGGTLYSNTVRPYSGTNINILGSTVTLEDGGNLVSGTTTGTKIGTATNQKLGFYNATPIVQPTGDIATALSNLGLVSTPTLSADYLVDGSTNHVFTATDDTKLAGIEALADVTDATNVAAAGALMLTGGTMTGDIAITHGSSPTVASGTAVTWAASGSGTKDGTAYDQGDVLITSNVGGTSKTLLVLDYSTL